MIVIPKIAQPQAQDGSGEWRVTGKKPEIEVLPTQALLARLIWTPSRYLNTLDMQCLVACSLSSQHLTVLPNAHPP